MDEARYRRAERRLWDSVGVLPTEHRVRLDRTAVTVRVQEVGEGPAVVFIHGGSNSSASWATLVARLDGFRCLLLDRPGCGLSEPPAAAVGPDELAQFSAQVGIDVLDAFGLESAHLVATSFGGYVALHTAAAHPDRLDRMVLFGWPVGAPVAKVPAVMRIGAIPWLGRMMLAAPANERTVRMMFRGIGLRDALERGRISQEVIDTFVALLRHTDTMRNELRNRFISPLRGLDDRLILSDELLGSIRTPIHFLWGENDVFGGPDVARDVVGRIPNASLEMMAGAGHAVWLDDVDHAAEVTSRFLGG